MSGPEDVNICPYNRAHSIYKGRMQFHLSRCRAQNPNAEYHTCPFNATHVVSKIEYMLHILDCEDRLSLDSFLIQVGGETKTQPLPNPAVPQLEEEWDNESCSDSVLRHVKEGLENRPTLVPLIGAPKSERRAHRRNQRIRIQQIMEANSKNTNDSGSMEGRKHSEKDCNKPLSPVNKSKTSSTSTVNAKNDNYVMKMRSDTFGLGSCEKEEDCSKHFTSEFEWKTVSSKKKSTGVSFSHGPSARSSFSVRGNLRK